MNHALIMDVRRRFVKRYDGAEKRTEKTEKKSAGSSHGAANAEIPLSKSHFCDKIR